LERAAEVATHRQIEPQVPTLARTQFFVDRYGVPLHAL
jgi:hypothetical protein